MRPMVAAIGIGAVLCAAAPSPTKAMGHAPLAPRTGPVVASVSAAPDTAAIGQTIRVVYEVRTPLDARVWFPARPADDSTWTWRGWKVERALDTPQGVRHRVTAQALAFRTGNRALPTPGFRVQTVGGAATPGVFPRLTLVIRSVLPRGNPPDIRDLKPVFPSPWWATFPWWVVIAVLALAAVVFFLLRRKRPVARVERQAKADVPTVSAHVEALAALDRLAAEKLPERGLWKDHQTRLAGILRRFLERRFGSPEPGYTTRELLLHLTWRGIGGGDVDRLRSLLALADLAKFARRELTPELARRQEEEARALVMALAETVPPAAADTPATLPKAG